MSVNTGNTGPLSVIGEHRIRATEQEALLNLHTVLQLCAAGELRCSERPPQLPRETEGGDPAGSGRTRHSTSVIGTPGVMNSWCRAPSGVRDIATPRVCPSANRASSSRVPSNLVWLMP